MVTSKAPPDVPNSKLVLTKQQLSAKVQGLRRILDLKKQYVQLSSELFTFKAPMQNLSLTPSQHLVCPMLTRSQGLVPENEPALDDVLPAQAPHEGEPRLAPTMKPAGEGETAPVGVPESLPSSCYESFSN